MPDIMLRFRPIALLALAYALLGQAGLVLAIPPGYASPVFPSSGLALACVLWFGRRVLPGVWLGSLLLNLANSGLNGTLSQTTVIAAIVIACGSTVQALVGSWLVERRLGTSWRELEREQDIFVFLMLGGVLAGLLSASISVSGLFALGAIKPAELYFTWWNWYVGDTVGILLFAPLFFCLLIRPSGLWDERRRQIIVPMLFIIGLMITAFYVVAQWEKQAQNSQLEEDGQKISKRIENRAISHREVLLSMRNFVEASPDFSFGQFEKFTSITLRDNPDIFALSYNDLVNHQERQEFERQMSGLSPLGEFRITERDSQRRLIPAAVRPNYVTVRYIVPLAGNKPAVGYDINSEPIRRDAINRAIVSSAMAVTSPIQLVQENRKRIGLLELLPVSGGNTDGESPQKPPRGFVVSVVKVDEMIEIATRGLVLPGLRFQLADSAAPAGQGLLYRSGEKEIVGKAPSSQVANWKTSLRMGDRDWELSIYADESYWQQHRPWIAWVVGVAGLLFAALLQVLMLGMTGRTAVIQRKNDALKASEDRYLSLFNDSPLPLLVYELGSLRILMVNDRAVGHYGWSREDFLCMKLSDVVHAEDVAVLEEIGGKQGVREVAYQCRHVRKDGSVINVLVHSSPARYGEIDVRMEAIKDVTQEIQLKIDRDEAERASLAKSRFLATMSHEIRTPMNGIIGLSQLALEKELPAEARSYLEKIHLSSRSLLGILNDILDYSKIESGRMELESSSFDLALLIDRLKNLFSMRAAEKRLEFRVSIDPDVPPQLMGDPLRLQQVLSNLLGNAIKFTEQGSVSLGINLVSLDGAQAKINCCVKDSGIGMDAEVVAHICQAFHQADNSISRRFGGTGLGLTICRELLALMDSELVVQSTPGKGSVFSFDLRLGVDVERRVDDAGLPSPAGQSLSMTDRLVARGRPLAGKRILVVEDNRINQQVVREFLCLAGMLVETASNGRQALEMLDKIAFDGVLMDVHMPEMDGLEATRRIRSRKEFENLPVIALTAGVTPDERKHSLDSGMNDMVAKPVEPDQLIRVLLRWIADEGSAESTNDGREEPPAPDQASHLPQAASLEIPGFVLDKVFLMLGSDAEKLISLLRMFHEDVRGSLAELEREIESGSPETVRPLVHRLKGAAGNIGAQELYLAAEKFNGELLAGTINPETLGALRIAFERAMNALERLPSAPSGTSRRIDPKALDEVLVRLEQLLASQELVPEELLAELASLLPESRSEDYRAFKWYVDNIDYAQALEVLRVFRQNA